MTDDQTPFDKSAYDMSITRTFDAPRERAWAAWTDPEQAAQWWGPAGFTVPSCELDVRLGGSFHIDMAAPDGTLYSSKGIFDEVDEPDRLVLIGGAVEDDDGIHQMEVRLTVTFADRDDKTALTLEAKVVQGTPDVAEYLDGMEEGWTQSLEKLDDYLDDTGGV